MKSAHQSLKLPLTVSSLNSECLTSDSLWLPVYELSDFPEFIDLPLFSSKISAGFVSPAEEHIESRIDLNRLYVKHPAATFFVRVRGHSMVGAGIHNGDMLVVDRALEAKSGSIVIVAINSDLTVKRLVINGDVILLVPENPEYEPIQICDDMELHVWGVVAHAIHSFLQ